MSAPPISSFLYCIFVLIFIIQKPYFVWKKSYSLNFLNRIKVILIDKTILNIGTDLYWCWWNYRLASVSTNEKTKTEKWSSGDIFSPIVFLPRFWTFKDSLIKPSGPLQLGVFLIKLFSSCVQKPPCGTSWVVVLRPFLKISLRQPLGVTVLNLWNQVWTTWIIFY